MAYIESTMSGTAVFADAVGRMVIAGQYPLDWYIDPPFVEAEVRGHVVGPTDIVVTG